VRRKGREILSRIGKVKRWQPVMLGLGLRPENVGLGLEGYGRGLGLGVVALTAS